MTIAATLTSPAKLGSPLSYMDRSVVKKWTLIALSTILALGMILSYVLGAPWLVVLGFFVLALVPLFPLTSTVERHRLRILG